ncbi:hypothetical protein [Campylobacter pinnipediorum]|nr:hypothetical protein [Campylobacter pinnipediorum]
MDGDFAKETTESLNYKIIADIILSIKNENYKDKVNKNIQKYLKNG